MEELRNATIVRQTTDWQHYTAATTSNDGRRIEGGGVV